MIKVVSIASSAFDSLKCVVAIENRIQSFTARVHPKIAIELICRRFPPPPVLERRRGRSFSSRPSLLLRSSPSRSSSTASCCCPWTAQTISERKIFFKERAYLPLSTVPSNLSCSISADGLHFLQEGSPLSHPPTQQEGREAHLKGGRVERLPGQVAACAGARGQRLIEEKMR